MANKKTYILVLCLCILAGSTKVRGMALFDFLRVSLFSRVNGQVLLKGEPVAGAEITRDAIYNQDNYVETTVSDENGNFHFNALDVHSVNRILPGEIVVTQEITIHHDGRDYLAWKTIKRSAKEDDELSGYLGKLVCDLSANEKQTETARSVIGGICQIEDSDKLKSKTSASTLRSSPMTETRSHLPGDVTIITINSAEFMFNAHEEGGDIIFKTPDYEHCRLSFIKSRIKPSYHTRTEIFGEGEVDLSCLTDKKLYAMSPISPTFIDMTVTETDSKDLSIKLVSTLYSTRTRESLENVQMELVVEGDRLGYGKK